MFLYIKPVKLKRRCRKVIYPQRVEMGDRYYFSLKLPIIKGVPQWQGLITSQRLLLPERLNPPEGFSIFGDYDWQLTLAAEKLKTKLQREKCDLLFVDKKGCRGGLLSRLAKCARFTTVITQNIGYYQALRDEIYGGLGCYIEINRTVGLTGGYTFVVDKEGDIGFKTGFRLFTVNSIGEEDIVIPADFIRYMPEGVSKCCFSEALYSAMGIGRLGDYISSK